MITNCNYYTINLQENNFPLLQFFAVAVVTFKLQKFN